MTTFYRNDFVAPQRELISSFPLRQRHEDNFPYHIRVPLDRLDDALNMAYDTFGLPYVQFETVDGYMSKTIIEVRENAIWGVHGLTFCFKNATEATMFKLHFG